MPLLGNIGRSRRSGGVPDSPAASGHFAILQAKVQYVGVGIRSDVNESLLKKLAT